MKKRLLSVALAVAALFCLNTNAIASSSGQYQLQDSTFYSHPAWASSQGAYGYAIGQINTHQPGFYVTGNDDKINSMPVVSIEDVAEIVKADLKTDVINKPCVVITAIRPTNASLRTGQSAICLRLGNRRLSGELGVHFMKLESDGTWRHKPGELGGTSVLTYKYMPSESRTWTDESSRNGYEAVGVYTYSGPIRFVIFSSSHGSSSATHQYTGNNYHSGSRHYYQYADVCSVCGDQTNIRWESIPCSGPPCADIMRVWPESEVS